MSIAAFCLNNVAVMVISRADEHLIGLENESDQRPLPARKVSKRAELLALGRDASAKIIRSSRRD